MGKWWMARLSSASLLILHAGYHCLGMSWLCLDLGCVSVCVCVRSLPVPCLFFCVLQVLWSVVESRQECEEQRHAPAWTGGCLDAFGISCFGELGPPLHDRHMHLVLLAWFLVFFVVFVGFSLLFIPHLSLLIFFHHSLPSLLLNSILLSFTSSPLVPPLFSSSCLFSSCSPPPLPLLSFSTHTSLLLSCSCSYSSSYLSSPLLCSPLLFSPPL